MALAGQSHAASLRQLTDMLDGSLIHVPLTLDAIAALPEAERAMLGRIASVMVASGTSPVAPLPPPSPLTPSPPPPPPPPSDARPSRVVLASAMVGTAYHSAALQDPSLSDYEGEAFGELGLAIDEHDGCVSGTPRDAGEHRVTVTAAPVDGSERRTIEAILVVRQDPKSLWKILEPPAGAPHPKPHFASVELASPVARIVGASKRGRSHAHAGSFREDDFGVRVVGDWHLLAVADGAGSAALSRLGSKLAVDTALATLEQHLAGRDDAALFADASASPARTAFLHDALLHAARAAAAILDDAAEHEAIERRALSTTLILVMVRKGAQGWFTASFGIGDGGAAIVGPGTATSPLTVPDGGEFAGQTRFLATSVLDDAPERRIAIDWCADLGTVMVMTDGITDAWIATETDFADPARWAALLGDIEASVDLGATGAAPALLDWLDFWSKGNHDDRTLVMLRPAS